MAIQFPPINPGDPQPQDGDTYLYLITQSEFVCHRNNQTQAAQWSEKGVINTTSFGYRGGIDITSPAPTDAEKGNIYSVLDGGTANMSFSGIGGDTIEQYTLIIYEDPNWIPINSETGNVIPGPWVRTIDGQISPAVETDNLNMALGNYLFNTLPEL